MTDLDELKALAQKATPGPWEAREMADHTPGRRTFWFEVGKWPDMVAHIQAHDEDEPNAAFIAAANPKTILALIERVERAEGAAGYVIVPAEPTPEMIEAGVAERDADRWPRITKAEKAEDVFVAMIRAAQEQGDD